MLVVVVVVLHDIFMGHSFLKNFKGLKPNLHIMSTTVLSTALEYLNSGQPAEKKKKKNNKVEYTHMSYSWPKNISYFICNLQPFR